MTERLDTGEYIAVDWYNGTVWVNLLSYQEVENTLKLIKASNNIKSI